ncbi:MAG: CoA transferase subunit A [Rhodobacterales bacterium]|nr:CoA transferase subunit A [Rhodobacterales bacterium]
MTDDAPGYATPASADGIGRLFLDPDPDKHRAFFASKTKKITDKRMSLKDAVATFIPDGCSIASGGFSTSRTSVSVMHEILRQHRKNLLLYATTSSYVSDLLAIGKCFDRVDVSYIVGMEARGLSPNARRWLESGEVEVVEWTNHALLVRLRAAAQGVPYGLSRMMLGSDTYVHSAAKIVDCPFTGQKYLALPAATIDVAIIHVHEADIYGNCRIRGMTGVDYDMSRAAKHVVITTERLIHNDEIRAKPDATFIPGYLVDAVIEVPFGAYPCQMAYEYASDEPFFFEQLKIEKDPEAFAAWCEEHIYNVSSHEEFIEHFGGLKRLNELRVLESRL